jgi:tape measure domain-containing protein
MSSKVDDRIVNMKFNNAQFEKGVADTSKSLEDLKKGLSFKDVGKGLGDLAGQVKNLSLDGLANGVQSVANKFSALSVIGLTTLANIANKAVDAGLQLVHSLTLEPIKSGFDEYELKMGSIQTILANTARYGTELPQVTAALDQLNTYADKTIYNFGDMTKNIGLFTNAGIRIEDATSMIKGFSNEAAASGTNAQGAAGAAYQLSQALSAGTIRLMDWRSLTNVGMGNKNMQTGLIEIADAMGTLEKNSISATDVQKDFNGSLEKNWLSADVMSTYLKIMAGDMTAAEQAALGLSDAQIQAFAKQASTAQDAATKVRTWTQLVGTLQESVGSGWSQTFDILLGNFNQATDLFSGIYNAIGPIIDQMSDARNKLLAGWAAGGGRESLINSVANAWKAAMAIIKPITDAFKEIFPPTTADQLIAITKGIENFTKSLMPSEKTIANIKSTAKGFFAVLDIGRMVIEKVVGLFLHFLQPVGKASGGILEMTGNLGDWLVKVRDAIKNGEGLTKAFEWLAEQGDKVVNVVKKIGKWLGDTFPVNDMAKSWHNVGDAIKAAWEWMQPFFKWVGEAFQNVKKAVKDAFATMDFNVLVGLLNTGVLAGIFVIIKKFIDKIPGMFKGMGGGIFDTIKGVFTSLTDTMEAMQQKLKSEVLIKIAIAIGILTVAVVALSFIDTGKLFTVLGAMSIMFTQLMAAMVVMEKATSSKGFLKMPVLAATMIGMAAAMVIFAAAVTIMAALDWEGLAKGLTGMAVGLGVMVGALALMDKIPAGLGKSAGSLILMSTALVILASALKIMGSMSWDDIGRALTVLAGGLAALAVGTKLIQGSIGGAAAMILVSTALTVISGAFKVFATMSWDDIGRSMTAMTGAVALLVGAVSILSTLKMAPVGAATMIAMAVAITILTGAMKIFATFSWDEIGRSMTMLAGSLIILAGAMALMGIPVVALGGLALLVASVGLMALAPALALLGTMSWDAIGRGLTMLAASLVILAAGGLLMIPASVGFLLLGAAILLIGTGAYLAGTGMVMFAAGFIALTGAAALGAEAIKLALNTIISMIPAAMAAFAQGLIDFATTIATGGAEFTAAMTTLLTSLITAIGTTGPLVINTLWELLMLMAAKLEENVPILVEKGGNLIIGVLNGMTAKIPGIAKAGTDLMIALMNAIAKEVPRLADAGAKAIVKLVNGIADAVENNSEAMGRAGGRLASAIISGMVKGIGAGVGEIIGAAKRMAQSALDAAKNLLGIHSPSRKFAEVGGFSSEGYAVGMLESLGVVEDAGNRVGETALSATKKSLANISNAVSDEMSMNPTIRPVLDLTQVQRDASLMNGMLTPPELKLDRSVLYANQAQQAGYLAAKSADEVELQRIGSTKGSDVNFYQTNNSPKALPASEIYRKTNNMLSVAKKELTTLDS